jgi:hypothetical protein
VNLPPGCPFTPRCPIAADVCQAREPDLEPVDVGPEGRGHLSACHLKDQLVRQDPADLFAATAADTGLPGDFGADRSSPDAGPGRAETHEVDSDYGTEDENR